MTRQFFMTIRYLSTRKQTSFKSTYMIALQPYTKQAYRVCEMNNI